jgi:hypothetical protein
MEQLEFDGGQWQRLTEDGGLLTGFIQYQILLQGDCLGRRAAQNGFDSGNHFTRTERLTDIIVGSQF